MIIELEKGDNLKWNRFEFVIVIKSSGERIKISWLSYLKLIDYRMIDGIKSHDFFERDIVNNYYKIDLEVVE